MKFATIVADPPWPMRDSLPGPKRGATKHYQLLSCEGIDAFLDTSGLRSQIAPDAFLFMWRLAAMQKEALRAVSEWGFEVKSEIVWAKSLQHSVPDSLLRALQLGMGNYVRMSHEVCLLARRGRANVHSHGVSSVFFAPRRKHSEKPEEFYTLVESLCPGPYLELFARKTRPGWTCLGNEL
jgi:N6-adenosine-specific RNA methylase IME4